MVAIDTLPAPARQFLQDLQAENDRLVRQGPAWADARGGDDRRDAARTGRLVCGAAAAMDRRDGGDVV